MSQSESGGKITPEDIAFGKKLEAEGQWGIPVNTPVDKVDAAVQAVVQRRLMQQMQVQMQAIADANAAAAARAKQSPPFRILTPDGRGGLIVGQPKQKKPSRLKKLLARLGGHKSA